VTAERADGCVGCELSWRHCHWTWIAHRDGGECSGDDACPEPSEAHDLLVVCTDLDAACACA
jgi:hypothetical protein